MGTRGPAPKLSSQPRRRNTTTHQVDVMVVHHCDRDDCMAVVGNAYHDPGGRWCARGHEQDPPQPVEWRHENR